MKSSYIEVFSDCRIRKKIIKKL